MAWGILEDIKSPRPPGTVLLHSLEQPFDVSSPECKLLKRHGDIVLQPQPSDSPNDPLNWSLRRKIAIFGTVMTVMTTMGAILGMLGTAGRIFSETYHTSYPAVIQKLGPPGTATTAITFFLSSAFAAVYGKRPQFMVDIVGLWLTMLVGIFARSMNWYQAVSVLQGFFTAPYELLLPGIVTDLMFVHQRGRLMGITAVIFVVGGDAGQIISGNIINRLGVKYLYIISFSILAPLMVIVYFLAWETTYLRPISKRVSARDDFAPVQETSSSDSPRVYDLHKDQEAKRVTIADDNALGSLAVEQEHSQRERLRIWRGRITKRNFFKAFLEPIPLLAFPAVLFSTILNGAYLTWTITTIILQYQTFLFKPYDMKPDTLAYVTLPGSGVNLIASIIAGVISDMLIKRMSRGNNGIYEPEYRLLMMLPAVIFSTCGFLAMGHLFEAKAKAWKLVLASLLFPLANPFATIATTPYILDMMQGITTEAFVIISLFRHIFILVVTNHVPYWFMSAGPLKVHNTLMILNLALSATTIPVYVYGKRIRGAISRTPALQIYADGNPGVAR